jgi:hypothetical protein
VAPPTHCRSRSHSSCFSPLVFKRRALSNCLNSVTVKLSIAVTRSPSRSLSARTPPHVFRRRACSSCLSSPPSRDSKNLRVLPNLDRPRGAVSDVTVAVATAALGAVSDVAVVVATAALGAAVGALLRSKNQPQPPHKTAA